MRIKQILKKFGDKTVALIRENMRKAGQNASGKTSRSIQSKATDNRVIVDAAKHIFVLEKGRGPGKMPPVDRIIEWAKIRGFEKPKSAGYAISKKIAEKGTKLFRDGGREDIITPAISDERVEELHKKLSDTLFKLATKRLFDNYGTKR